MVGLFIIVIGIAIFVFNRWLFNIKRKQRRNYYRNAYLKSVQHKFIIKNTQNIILVKNQSNVLFQYANLVMTSNIIDRMKMPNAQQHLKEIGGSVVK